MQPPKVWLGNQKDFRFVWNAINKVDTVLLLYKKYKSLHHLKFMIQIN